MSCDCEPAAFYCEDWRKARKAHRCYECAAWIVPGDRYCHGSGVWDHQPSSFATCVQCVQVRDWYVASLPRWDCGPCFGGLYNEIPRADWPPHVVVAQAALRAERAQARDQSS